MNKVTVQAHIIQLRASGAPASSINQRLTTFRKFAQKVADNGLIDKATTQALRRVTGVHRDGQRLGNWLSTAQAQALLEAPNLITPKNCKIVCCWPSCWVVRCAEKMQVAHINSVTATE